MKSLTNIHLLSLLAGTISAVMLAIPALAAGESPDNHGGLHGNPPVEVIRGIAVTGPNSLLGQQVADFGPGGSTGSDLVAEFDPNGDVPLSLSPATPRDSLVATTAADDADSALWNLPLRQVPTNISSDGNERASLPGQLSADTFDFNQAEPAEPITFHEWLEAEGRLRFRCHANGTATVDVRVRNLIPNRVFTLWALFGESGAIPFGGAPNVIMTDEYGDGRFHRRLNFCPSQETDNGDKLDQIVVVFHSDQQNYATQPTLPDRGFPPGIVAHPQLQFTIDGVPLLD
ncbi:MAG: hypothetical protein WD397_13180 [Wenzhouxiangellaceae bacterium]